MSLKSTPKRLSTSFWNSELTLRGAFTSCLQSGQSLCPRFSHSSTHSLWKVCMHGSTRI